MTGRRLVVGAAQHIYGQLLTRGRLCHMEDEEKRGAEAGRGKARQVEDIHGVMRRVEIVSDLVQEANGGRHGFRRWAKLRQRRTCSLGPGCLEGASPLLQRLEAMGAIG